MLAEIFLICFLKTDMEHVLELARVRDFQTAVNMHNADKDPTKKCQPGRGVIKSITLLDGAYPIESGQVVRIFEIVGGERTVYTVGVDLDQIGL